MVSTSANWVSDGFICSHGKTKEDHERNETKLTQLAPKEPYPLVISMEISQFAIENGHHLTLGDW